MFLQSLRTASNKANERAVDSKVPSAIQISNRAHRRAVFATICIILVAILGTIIVNSGSSRTVAYASSMRGVGVGIYWDQACTNKTLSLNWGLINPGSNSTVRVYIRNEGDSVVSLWMATSNWTPSVASSYLTLSWTYSGRILRAYEVVPIELKMNVSPTVSGITDFGVDIVVTVTGK